MHHTRSNSWWSPDKAIAKFEQTCQNIDAKSIRSRSIMLTQNIILRCYRKIQIYPKTFTAIKDATEPGFIALCIKILAYMQLIQ